jgi:hypothetical protein
MEKTSGISHMGNVRINSPRLERSCLYDKNAIQGVQNKADGAAKETWPMQRAK